MFRLGRVAISFQDSIARTIPAMTNTPEMGTSYFYPRASIAADCQMVDFFKTEKGKAYIGRYKASIATWWPHLRIFCCLPAPIARFPPKPPVDHPDQRLAPDLGFVATYIERVETRQQYSSMCWIMAGAIFLGVRWAPASNSC